MTDYLEEMKQLVQTLAGPFDSYVNAIQSAHALRSKVNDPLLLRDFGIGLWRRASDHYDAKLPKDRKWMLIRVQHYALAVLFEAVGRDTQELKDLDRVRNLGIAFETSDSVPPILNHEWTAQVLYDAYFTEPCGHYNVNPGMALLLRENRS